MSDLTDNISDEKKFEMINEMTEKILDNDKGISDCLKIIGKYQDDIKTLQEANEVTRARIHKLINYHKP